MDRTNVGFIRGLLGCADMLETLDMDECTIASVEDNRDGRPQNNAVRQTLGQVLMRGDPDELNGFCAALTDIIASADESGDYYRMLKELAEQQQAKTG
jgi:hypothetical protein